MKSHNGKTENVKSLRNISPPLFAPLYTYLQDIHTYMRPPTKILVYYGKLSTFMSPLWVM